MAQFRKGDYKMKKFLALIGIMTCIFALTACGEQELTEYEQQKVAYAEQYAASTIVPFMQNFMDDANINIFDGRTAAEIENIFENNYQISADGYAIKSGISSFHSAASQVGKILSIGEAKATIDDDQIIVLVQVEGEKKDAEAEVILSNDMFMKVESVALNPISTMGSMMMTAVMNTLIGMGTVFVVLILISAIISAFSVIPKLEEKFAAKKNAAPAGQAVAAKADAEVTEIAENEQEAEDTEFVAVIAAAVAAYEGASGTDGFVVRSIHRRRR